MGTCNMGNLRHLKALPKPHTNVAVAYVRLQESRAWWWWSVKNNDVRSVTERALFIRIKKSLLVWKSLFKIQNTETLWFSKLWPRTTNIWKQPLPWITTQLKPRLRFWMKTLLDTNTRQKDCFRLFFFLKLAFVIDSGFWRTSSCTQLTW